MSSGLEVRGVSFSYPGGEGALDGLSLAFPKGGRHAVLGANGAGKSTLFLLLNGVLRPSSGQVCFEGEPLCYSRSGLQRIRSRVGILFQDPDAQLLSASILEDVSFGPMNLGLPPAVVRQRVEEALSATGLEALAHRPVHALSFGQKRRVGIAGLLAMKPDYLILDEPSAGLDRRSCEDFFGLLETLHRQGVTIILSTHSVDLAHAWADTVVLLKEGRLAASCEAPDFARGFLAIAQQGWELPLVVQLHQALSQRGLLPPAAGPVPRNPAELLGLISRLEPSTACLAAPGSAAPAPPVGAGPGG